MLEVSTLRSPNEDRRSALDHGGFPAAAADSDFIFDDNLLDYIDFSCDVPFFADDGDILPDLEVDPTELLAEFSPEDAPAVNQAEPLEGCGPGDAVRVNVEKPSAAEEREKEGDKEVKSGGDEGVSAVTTEDSAAAGSDARSLPSAEGHSKRKPPSAAKNSQGKRKVKVDWTPELHRRFVQAVEQLGIDKAVPSRILELMGIECLTRHNIASHLQKYRSHRKHLLAREAEAAGWAQKHQLYTGGHGASRKDVSPWLAAPTMGFPHPPPPPPAAAAAAAGMVPPFRPLHVWGHPTAVEPPPMLPLWPRHLAPPLLPPWARQPAMAPQPADAAYWLQHYNARKWAPQAVTQGTPCMPPPVPAMLQRFPAPAPVAGMVAHPMYRPMPPPPPPAGKHAGLQLPLDAHPSKDSIDAAIGDVLVKPWLPLPLGLKPPSMDSVMAELHKQGIPKVPPASGAG